MSLNLKKTLTKILTLIQSIGGFTGNEKEYSLTYVNNPYFTEEDVERITYYRTGARSGIIRLNLQNSKAAIPASQSATTTIATLSITPRRDTYLTIASQRGNGAVLQVSLNSDKIVVANFGTTAIAQYSFFRTSIPVVLPHYFNGGGVIHDIIHKIKLACANLREEVSVC